MEGMMLGLFNGPVSEKDAIEKFTEDAMKIAELEEKAEKRLERALVLVDMEEQGRLQILPCAPGATVYVTDLVDGEAVPCEVLCFSEIDGSGEMTVECQVPKEVPRIVSVLCRLSDFGKTVFLTREFAEKALRGGAKLMDRAEAIKRCDRYNEEWANARPDDEPFIAYDDELDRLFYLAGKALREQEQLQHKLEMCQKENNRLMLKCAGVARPCRQCGCNGRGPSVPCSECNRKLGGADHE